MSKIFKKISLIGLLLFFFLFSSLVAFIVDWWWLSEVGHEQIFIKSISAKAGIFLAVALFSVIFLHLNFLIANRSKSVWVSVLPAFLVGSQASVDKNIVRKISLLISVLIAIFVGLVFASSWQDILKYLSRESFGINDPIFGLDIAFYIFSLPVFQMVVGLFKFLVLLALAGSAFIYFLRGKFNFSNLLSLKKMQMERDARVHLGLLLFIFMGATALTIYLSRFGILTSQGGLVYGATYIDEVVRMPMLWVSMIIAILVGFSALIWSWKGNISLLLGMVFVYILSGVAGTVAPSIVQKLIVAPNELVKETPYVENNIAATRQAFALDNIEEREISGDKAISADDIEANNLTIKNVRLWDRKPLLSTFSQIQEIRTYYEFVEVDNDRYNIDGEIRQVMLSPRELSSASLPNRNWINEHLTFTHGYGVAAGPVNQVTPEGLPVLFVKDLPPKSDVKELEIARPEIYYGELMNDYVITNTKSQEFDYPKGEENVYSTYNGSGGVKIDSFLKRVLFAIKFQSLKIFLSNDVTEESRIMYYRNVEERVAKIAPFLTFDSDPYTVIDKGNIYWIADAYTTSNNYPYSQPLPLNGKKVNYIRNSVKVVVNAYDGSVDFYQADPNDPIIKTYAKIFPGIFKPMSEMPEGLIAHMRYPEDIFGLQTASYLVYHMDDPQVFYNKEDQWEVPAIAMEGEDLVSTGLPLMQPRHNILKLPGETNEEYVLMLPFTPRGKDNLSSWMVARNDGENYGKLLVYKFPKDKLIYGPKQIIGRINQDPVVSQQISLWSQGGSQVIQGTLLVIPIEESLLYVRPLYLKADNGKIPELKRVVVAYENKIAMEETLEEGLYKIFGSEATEEETVKDTGSQTNIPVNIEKIIKDAVTAYEEAISAQKNGNWANYGEAIKRLGDILKQ